MLLLLLLERVRVAMLMMKCLQTVGNRLVSCTEVVVLELSWTWVLTCSAVAAQRSWSVIVGWVGSYLLAPLVQGVVC